jgi:signal transduction histidine kinase
VKAKRASPTIAKRIRARFAAARTADAPELAQAKLRVAMAIGFIAYFVVAFLVDRTFSDRELTALAAAGGIFAADLAHLAAVLIAPGVSRLRRCLGALLDAAATTTMMILAGGAGAILAGFLIWVPIGNGFRFGRWYLHFSQALSLAGLATVLVLSDFWHQRLTVGAAFVVALLAVPWYVSLLIAGLHAVNRRLQEARAEAEAANVAKSKFLAAASHDLRQPMQALSMYASVLEERASNADERRLVHGVQLSVATLERMFDSLLDIARLESGVVNPSVIDFPLMPLIESVVEAERPLAENRGLDLRAVPTRVSVRSDPVLLERMLKNLVTNAIRYTERGRIVVGCRRGGAERICLEVVDSGIGIAAEEQERIFEEYYQVSGSSAQGLGLGLPIVRSLGLLLGHRVSVRSAPGRGSAFSIELPRAADPAPRPAPPAPASSLGRLNIVLLDDDVEIRRSMTLLLQSWGCRTFAAGTIGEVEAALRSRRIRPDALIVDYRLADATTGLDALRRLRSRFGEHVPALIMSGTATPGDWQSRAGSVTFAVKPVPPGKLRAFLSHALQQA